MPFVKNNMTATSQVKTGLAAVKASFKDIFSEEDNFVEKTWEVNKSDKNIIIINIINGGQYRVPVLLPH